ncbi:MAG: DUF2177 family protein [Devosia sp.]
MLKMLTAYGATTVVFLALDALWLSLVALGFYRRELGPLLLEQPNLLIAGLFYLVYAVGIVFFAVNPALNGGGWGHAAIAGAVLGLVAYGTYDITNLSTLKGWSVAVTMADIAWGTILTAIAATAGYLITARLPV